MPQHPGSSHNSNSNGTKGTEPMKKMQPQIGFPGNNPSGKSKVGKAGPVFGNTQPKGSTTQDSYNAVIGTNPSLRGARMKGTVG